MRGAGIMRTVDLSTMEFTVMRTTIKDEKKLRMVLDLLESRKYPVILLHEEMSAVVYVPTKPDARRLIRPWPSPPSHVKDFQQGNIDVMVATDAYGQGIDKADIRLIVHWEPPVNLEMHHGCTGGTGGGKPPWHLTTGTRLEDLDEEEREARFISIDCTVFYRGCRCIFRRNFVVFNCHRDQVEFASRGALKDLVTSKKMCRWNQILKYYDCEDELPKEGRMKGHSGCHH
eukprot:Skav217139  [mRNA]  locus=scaffold1539:167598:172972:- [translate_table: standard]